MAHKPKPPQEEESGESAPLWIISFADMISLLMAFFVMLSTFSNFGPSEAAKVRKAVKAALAPNYGWQRSYSREAVGSQSPAAGQFEKGSERPTVEDTQGKGLLAESKAEDFRSRKVFVIESKKVFRAAGAALSGDGRDFLDTLASFVSQQPGRIVISESGPGRDPDVGLLRAVTTLQYLANKGISRGRCSVGAQGMRPDQAAGTGRLLEIALLEEGLYQ